MPTKIKIYEVRINRNLYPEISTIVPITRIKNIKGIQQKKSAIRILSNYFYSTIFASNNMLKLSELFS